MATIATEAAPIYTEEGRHEKKRLELKKKLEEKRAKQEASSSTTTAAEAAKMTSEQAQKAAKIAKDAAAAIEATQSMDKEAPRKAVKIAGKSHITTEVKLTKNETARIQAKCAAGHAAKIKATVNEKNKNCVLDSSNLPNDHVVVFTGCEGCEFLVSSECIKVFIEKCTNCTFRFEERIVTAVVEVDRCEQCNILFGTPVGTLQVEQCKRVNVVYAHKALMIGYIIWAGCFTLRIQVGDDLMRCDFDLTKGFDPTINIERTQFKISYNPLGKLMCEKIIRLKNGYPTTKAEDDEFQRKHEQTLTVMADRMGITIHKKGDRLKIKPNAPCPCGSKKKYKKCCKSGKIDSRATSSVEDSEQKEK